MHPDKRDRSWSGSRRVAAVVVPAIVAVLSGAVVAQAQPLPPPRGPVVLTITGDIGVTNAAGTAQFDLAMLSELPRVGFDTSTIWTDGVSRFDGVALNVLLDLVEARGGSVVVTAINDYFAEIPVAEIGPQAPILADQRDGRPMSVRHQGPLWLVYPYDSGPEYRTEMVYLRSVWQVQRIEVRD